MKPRYDRHTGARKSPHLRDPLEGTLANLIKKHADYRANEKCVWWLKFLATDIAEVLIPEAAAYDSLQVNYLHARLKAMGQDITLLEQRHG